MHKMLSRLLLVFVMAGGLAMSIMADANAAGEPAADGETVVATVDGMPITEADLALAAGELSQQLDQLGPEQKRAAALSAMIEIKLAAAESVKLGTADDADFKRRMTFLRERALHSAFVDQKIASAVTNETVRARYDQEIAAIPAGNEVRASHILISACSDVLACQDLATDEEKAKAEAEAKSIIAELDAGGDFAELAKQHSSDGSAQSGGDLGYFGKGKMVPEFEDSAFSLDVGEYTKEPVKTQYGYHIIKVVDKRPQQPPAFEQVEKQLRSMLLREKYFAEVAALREAAAVEITDPELKAAVEAIDGPRQ